MKNVTYEYKVDTRDELFQQISDAARHTDDAKVLYMVTLSTVKQVRIGIQAESNHFDIYYTELYSLFPELYNIFCNK